MKALSVLVLLVALAAAFLWEGRVIATLHAQREALLAAKLEAAQLEAETGDLPKLRAAAAQPADSGDNAELLRLRNEVRRLRAQQQEVGKLRAANERLAGEIKSGKFAPRRMADVEGAVPREKWSFVGFATPEATVQSFFAAVASGDPEQFLRCAGPRTAERMRRDFAKDPEKERKEFNEEMGKMGKVSGFRIVGTRPKDEDGERMEVLVQVVADGESMPLSLRRFGNEWKFDD